MAAMIALLAGLIFGAGLVISGMINPDKVQNFLDVTGTWDPSLALVMGSAIPVAWIGYRIAARLKTPLAADHFELPPHAPIDRDLVLGAVLFGLGWGLVGYCPGPAIAALSNGSAGTAGFVAASIAGLVLAALTKRRRALRLSSTPPE